MLPLCMTFAEFLSLMRDDVNDTVIVDFVIERD